MDERILNPPDERRRLEALRQLLILDTEAEPLFQAIARQAAEVCGAPFALITLVDAERQWFKANIGLPGLTETPRDSGFCAYTIAGQGLFEVRDADGDPRFAANPLVTGAPHARYYAGWPLILPAGERVGTLCVVDRQPRALNTSHIEALSALSELAVEALRMRHDLLQRGFGARGSHEVTYTFADTEELDGSHLEDQAVLISVAKGDGTLLFVNRSYAEHLGKTPGAVTGHSLFEFIDPGDRAEVRQMLEQVFTSGKTAMGENRWIDPGGGERWLAWTYRARKSRQGEVLLHAVGRDVTDRKRAEAALQASQFLLQRTGRLAGVGGWELDLATGHVSWSVQTRHLHEVPADFEPTLDSAISFYAPESRKAIETAVRRGIDLGEPWDLELQVITAKGRTISGPAPWARLSA